MMIHHLDRTDNQAKLLLPLLLRCHCNTVEPCLAAEVKPKWDPGRDEVLPAVTTGPSSLVVLDFERQIRRRQRMLEDDPHQVIVERVRVAGWSRKVSQTEFHDSMDNESVLIGALEIIHPIDNTNRLQENLPDRAVHPSLEGRRLDLAPDRYCELLVRRFTEEHHAGPHVGQAVPIDDLEAPSRPVGGVTHREELETGFRTRVHPGLLQEFPPSRLLQGFYFIATTSDRPSGDPSLGKLDTTVPRRPRYRHEDRTQTLVVIRLDDNNPCRNNIGGAAG
jgi:hypothetical protein